MSNPPALTVVFLGPDGSGKSTIAGKCIVALQSEFPKAEYNHWRPGILRKNADSDAVTNPHGQLLCGTAVSIAKLMFLLLDYVLERAMRAFRRSRLVVFDRYYDDLLVDPKRYRYGGPMWLAQWIGKLVPQPDLWILLDAPSEVLHARKQEVAFEETVHQREAYLRLVQSKKNGVVVDASQLLDVVVREVNARILDRMATLASGG